MESVRKFLKALPFENIVLVLVCLGSLWGYVVWMVHNSYQSIEEQNEKAREIPAAMENKDYYGLRCGELFLPRGKASLMKEKKEVFVPSKTFPFVREKEVFVYKIFSPKGKLLSPKDCDPVFRDGLVNIIKI